MEHSKTFHSVAVAGAGTGKTYSLVENYLCALFGLDESGIKKRPHELLALTFTQKAANEMRVRIAERLTGFLQEKNDKLDPLHVMAQERHVAIPNTDEIKRILRALPNATIATFHGFCSQLLREESLNLGIGDDFEILSPGYEFELARNILRPIIVSKIRNDDKIFMGLVARFKLGNSQQSEGLIDAILRTYFSLFENGIDLEDLKNETGIPSENELWTAVQGIHESLLFFRSLPCSPTTGARIVGIAGCFDKFKTSLEFKDEQNIAQAWQCLRSSVSGNFGERTARRNLVDAVAMMGSRLVDFFVKSDEKAICRIIVEFHDEFNRFKALNSRLTYGDLLLKTRDGLAYNHDFRRRVKLKFNHILVDEYQDTSPLQEDLIALIAENKNTEAKLSDGVLESVDFSEGASLFVVGDKKQSIYGFRGANTKLFDKMIEKMAATSAPERKFNKRLLTVNRRSQSNILSLINLVSRNSLGSQGYDLAEDLQPLNPDRQGQCALWVANQDDETLDRTQNNLRTAVFGIGNLLKTRPDLKPCDIVVLVRRIKSALPIKKGLKTLGISSRIVGGEGFFQQLEIVEILSALKLINNPGHQIASAVVFRSPLVLLSDTEILQAASVDGTRKELSFLRAMKCSNFTPGGGQRFQQFADCLHEVKSELLQNGLVWAIDKLIDACDYSYSLGLKHNADQAFANIRKLKELIIARRENPFCLIDELFGEIDNNSGEPQAHSDDVQDQVTIMTIHQSKGLEFKVVVLADGESRLPNNSQAFLCSKAEGMGVSPKGRPIALCAPVNADEKQSYPTKFDKIKLVRSDDEQQEMARLLYVALTRAREELYMVSSKNGFDDGAKTKSILGLFLRAYEHEPAQFLEYCTVHNVEPMRGLRSEEVEVDQNQGIVFSNPRVGPKRLFSSMLKSVACPEFSEIIFKDFVKNKHRIDGDLAHTLMASAGQVLAGVAANDAEIGEIIRASLRAEGLLSTGVQIETTLNAVKSSLTMLKPSFCAARRVIFEMPLTSQPSDSVVVEGFADLVLEFDQYVAVIEFKSSFSAATHPNTYMQLFAYAHALTTRFKKPVELGVILIGAKQELVFKNYDSFCRNLFIKNLGQL